MLSGTSYLRTGDTLRAVDFTATPLPAGATLGVNVWVTISQFDNRERSDSADSYVTVRSITTSSITFQTRSNNPTPGDLPFTFICVYQNS
jgi:hypothetical protein